MKSKELLFIYNANSGLLNAIKDSFHKLTSPSTYDCNLCALTYTPVSMRRDWRWFVKNLPLPVKFLHKDELIRNFGLDEISLPSVMVLNGSAPEVLIPAREINEVASLEHLMNLVYMKVLSLDVQ